MAHFAKLNSSNIVEQVIVIANEILLDENEIEQENLGIEFCQSLFGKQTNWKQTSFNNSFRGNFACIGMKYDENADQFLYGEN